ncbi:hypothetical protein FRC05_010726 [Tulasnella sp. 425]|nr:hypothetical protein FRC05_010726 [Tulasnella sp. 425]
MPIRTIPTNVLDHIIHLSPPGELHAGIERFEKLGFKVLPGGTHADGLTYNALVVLNDGVYLELIAFTHDVDYYSESTSSSSVTPELIEKRKKHWWGYKSPGWIDWANLGFGGEKMADIVMNANSDGGVVADGGSVDVKYLAPVEGGRTKPDGDVLQWRVTFPDSAVHGRGTLPFFCEDVTPRIRRVPLSKSEGSESSALQPVSDHPCAATGIAYISLSTSTSMDFTNLRTQLSLVLGENPRISADGEEARWTLKTPQGMTTTTASAQPPRAEIVLRTANTPDLDLPIPGNDKAWIDAVGFWVADNDAFARERGAMASSLDRVSGTRVAFVPLPRTT